MKAKRLSLHDFEGVEAQDLLEIKGGDMTDFYRCFEGNRTGGAYISSSSEAYPGYGGRMPFGQGVANALGSSWIRQGNSMWNGITSYVSSSAQQVWTGIKIGVSTLMPAFGPVHPTLFELQNDQGMPTMNDNIIAGNNCN